MRLASGSALFAAIATFAGFAMFYADVASSEPLDLGGGLTVEPPETLDLTLQVIPSYDPKKKVLAGWNGKTLQYFGTAQRLPPEWLSADKYLAGLVRDLRAASAHGAFTSGRTGSYKALGGLSGTYLEYSLVVRGQSKSTRQVVHFLTDSKTSFIAFVTLVDDTAKDEFLDESVAIFRTAAIGGAAPTAASSDESRLFGKWVDDEKTPDGRAVVSHTELKSDLSFVSDVSVGGNIVLRCSGVWSLDGKVLTWNYLYSSPALPENARIDTDDIVSVDNQTLVTVSKRGGQRHQFRREN
jgi:hypothetical protein